MQPINRILSLWLSVIILSSGILVSIFHEYVLVEKEKTHYSEQINTQACFFANKLAFSLAHHDLPAIYAMARIAIDVEHIQAIEVYDASAVLVASLEHRPDKNAPTFHRDIRYQDKPIGSLTLTAEPFDPGPIWSRAIKSAGTIILPILILSVLLTLFILRHYLALPLKELRGYIQSISEGNYGEDFKSKGGVEIASIGYCVQNLSRELLAREKLLQIQEDELKKNLEKYKTLFSIIPLGITITDPEGKILELNSYSEKLLGGTAEEHLQRRLDEQPWQVLRPDGTPASMEEYTAVKALRENKNIVNQDVMHKGADGNIHWLNITAAPIPLKEYGVVVAVSDVTERKKLEGDLQAYKNMVSTSNDLMVLIGTDYRYQIVNEMYADYKDQSVETFIGMKAYGDEENQKFSGSEKKDLDRCLDGESFRVQKWIEYPRRGKRYMDISYLPYRDHEKIQGIVLECRDLTDIIRAEEEREKLRKQLFQSQKMESIGTLAGGIAHDFNNILASILGYTELSLQDIEQGSTLEKYLKMVYAGGIRAKDLVRQIQVVARQTEEALHPIWVANLAKEVLKLIRSSIPSTIEIKSNIDSNSRVMGNAPQVQQIFMNLLTNASQAMEEDGGSMELRLRDVVISPDRSKKSKQLKPGDYIEITISDTGCGIPPEIINSIFDPYFTTKKPGSGTGMGLALTQSIIQTYEGTIEVSSEPGKGSVFTLFLPIINEKETAQSPQPMPLKQGTERILFVDDESAITSVASDFLQRLGYTVTVTNSSPEALEIFSKNPHDFDLVISDMTMPVLTGDKVSSEILALRPDLPIILCTGYSNKMIDRKAQELGIKALLNKPVSNGKLATTIRRILNNQHLPSA